MHSIINVSGLIAVTLLAALAAALAVARLAGFGAGPSPARPERWLVALAGLGSAALFLHRVAHSGWRPLEAHVDGLLLLAALLAGTILLVQGRGHLPGMGAFACPLLALMLAWAVCAATFTFELFSIGSVWNTLHKASVYLGAVLFTLAGAAGLMFLHVDRRLRNKANPGDLGRVGNLESIERLMIGSAAGGFALMTLGLATGLVIVIGDAGKLGPGWWHSPKVLIGTAAWLVFALVMNVRHAAHFRGKRAAWLSLAGLLLVLATFALAVSAGRAPAPTPASQPTPGQAAATHRAGNGLPAVASRTATDGPGAPAGGAPCG